MSAFCTMYEVCVLPFMFQMTKAEKERNKKDKAKAFQVAADGSKKK